MFVDFHHQMHCRLLFLSLLFRVRDRCIGLRPHTSGGMEFCNWDIPLASGFSTIAPGWGSQHFLCLFPSYQSLCGFFCKSSVIICYFSQTSLGYSGLLLYNLAINSVWGQVQVNVASTYSAAILESLFWEFELAMGNLSCSQLICKMIAN